MKKIARAYFVVYLLLVLSSARALASHCQVLLMGDDDDAQKIAQVYKRLIIDSEILTVDDLILLRERGSYRFEGFLELDPKADSNRMILQEGFEQILKAVKRSKLGELLKREFFRTLETEIQARQRDHIIRRRHIDERDEVQIRLPEYKLKIEGSDILTSGFSPNSRYLGIISRGHSGGKLQIWDLSRADPKLTSSSDVPKFEFTQPNNATIAVSNDGEKVFLQQAELISVFTPKTAALLPLQYSTLKNNWTHFDYLRLSRDGTRLLTKTRAGMITIWDLASQKAIVTSDQTLQKSLNAASFTPDGQGVILRGSNGVVIWNYQTDTKTVLLVNTDDRMCLYAAEFSKDGSVLAFSFYTDIYVLRMSDLQVIQNIRIGFAGSKLSFTDDQTHLYFTQSPNHQLIKAPIAAGKWAYAFLAQFPFSYTNSLTPALSPDGQWYFRGDGTLIDSSTIPKDGF